MAESESQVATAARELQRARAAQARAMDKVRWAVVQAVMDGMTEAEAARIAGVDRMTVRKWLGKR